MVNQSKRRGSFSFERIIFLHGGCWNLGRRNTLPAIMTNERERFYFSFFLPFFFRRRNGFDGYYSSINSFYRSRISPFRGYNVKLETAL